MLNNLIRRPAVSTRLGIKKSTTYAHMHAGLITPAVQCGPRAVAWPSHEIDAIIAARIAGRTEDQIKALVASLTAARQSAPNRTEQMIAQREVIDLACRNGAIKSLSKTS